jgi:hypothetical protein
MRVAGPNPNTAYTRSSTLTSRSNVFVSKSGCTSIRRPPGSTTASPKVASCCVGDFLAANSTFTNRPAEETGLHLLFQRRLFRWRSSVLKLKPRLRQNSLRRIPLLVNSAPTPELLRVYVVCVLKPFVLRSSENFNTKPRPRTDVLVRRLRFSRPFLNSRSRVVMTVA